MRTILIALFCVALVGCNNSVAPNTPEASSGVKKATVHVHTDSNGHTTEQNNVLERYKRDNEPGAIKHMYLISPFSGQVVLYSPVRGKVTSSGKRLTPTSVIDSRVQQVSYDTYGFDVNIDGKRRTTEVLQDDGTYGSSSEYIFWFTPGGQYYQWMKSGLDCVISDSPISVKNVTIVIEDSKK